MHQFGVNDEITIATACPECGAREYEKCTYLYPKAVSQQAILDYWQGKDMSWWSKGTVKQVLRYGKPTVKMHNGRHNAARERLVEQYRRRHKPLVKPTSADARAAHRAMVAWDKAEYDKLRAWLKLYGSLLTGAEKDLEIDPLKVH